MIGTWKLQFLTAAQAFENTATNNAEQERIAELERMLGKLTIELEIAKKASRLLDGMRRRNGW
jgi:transposase